VFKMNYLKRQGQDNGVTGLAQREMGPDARPVWEEETR
jgi:hypothetical protein